METRSSRRKTRKTRSWVKWTAGLIIFCAVLVLGFGGYLFFQAYQAAKSSYQPIDRPEHKSQLRETVPTIGQDPISILLMGIEDYSTDGENGRADTLIVVTLNPDTDEMTMVSVPRDTKVEIDEIPKWEGTHKINSAYTYGAISGYGANKLAIQKVEELLEVPIDEYVAVDFKGFVEVVNALGGVTVDIKYGFWEENIFNHDKKIYFEKGTSHLNGEEALAFVRMRKRDVNTVYSRMERQRQFLKSALDQAISAGTVFKIDEIGDILGEHVETSLTPSEIYSLEKVYSSMDPSSIRTLKIEGADKRIPTGTGPYYFIPDEDSLSTITEKLKKSLGLETDTSSSEEGSTDNSSEETTESDNGTSDTEG
ncbi:MAG TPA: LCP family protein [Bacillales bacterium]|nr:LCP family protein [Bacillales bacterium]